MNNASFWFNFAIDTVFTELNFNNWYSVYLKYSNQYMISLVKM